jgi:hypothetical protein
MSRPADRRNPYLVLGVDYGASREEVTAAYTRRSRVARADSGYPYSIDDLVWALDEIEGIDRSGAVAATGAQAAALVFRVPADASVYEPPPGPGLLRPEPVPLRRRSRPAPRTEIAGLVNDARRDATAYALERLADQVERTLVAPAGRIRLSVPEPPHQPRSRGPVLAIVGALVLAVVAAVVFVVGRSGGDDAVATTTSRPPDTTPFVSVTNPPAEGFQTPVESDGVQITPHDAVTGFGVSCILWDLAGPSPLTFDPAGAELVIGATTLGADPAATSGRVEGAIDPTATTATAETCFTVGDSAPPGTQAELHYTPPGAATTPYRWRVTMP